MSESKRGIDFFKIVALTGQNIQQMIENFAAGKNKIWSKDN